MLAWINFLTRPAEPLVRRPSMLLLGQARHSSRESEPSHRQHADPRADRLHRTGPLLHRWSGSGSASKSLPTRSISPKSCTSSSTARPSRSWAMVTSGILPVLTCLLLFILLCNLRGVVAWRRHAYRRIHPFRSRLAVFAFVYYNWYGIRAQGPDSLSEAFHGSGLVAFVADVPDRDHLASSRA
jgi:hypothetical protein